MIKVWHPVSVTSHPDAGTKRPVTKYGGGGGGSFNFTHHKSGLYIKMDIIFLQFKMLY